MCWEENVEGKSMIRMIRFSIGALVQIFVCFDILLLIASVVTMKTSNNELCSKNYGILALWLIGNNILNFLGKLSMLFGMYHKKGIEK